MCHGVELLQSVKDLQQTGRPLEQAAAATLTASQRRLLEALKNQGQPKRRCVPLEKASDPVVEGSGVQSVRKARYAMGKLRQLGIVQACIGAPKGCGNT
jgi:hypothetical protein